MQEAIHFSALFAPGHAAGRTGTAGNLRALIDRSHRPLFSELARVRATIVPVCLRVVDVFGSRIDRIDRSRSMTRFRWAKPWSTSVRIRMITNRRLMRVEGEYQSSIVRVVTRWMQSALSIPGDS